MFVLPLMQQEWSSVQFPVTTHQEHSSQWQATHNLTVEALIKKRMSTATTNIFFQVLFELYVSVVTHFPLSTPKYTLGSNFYYYCFGENIYYDIGLARLYFLYDRYTEAKVAGSLLKGIIVSLFWTRTDQRCPNNAGNIAALHNNYCPFGTSTGLRMMTSSEVLKTHSLLRLQ